MVFVSVATHRMTKFQVYLRDKLKLEWKEGYLDYVALKALIKEAVRASEDLGSDITFSPRETSLSVQRVTNLQDAAEENFYTKLEFEVGVSMRPQHQKYSTVFIFI